MFGLMSSGWNTKVGDLADWREDDLVDMEKLCE